MSDGRRTSDGGVAPFAGDNSRNDNPSVRLRQPAPPFAPKRLFKPFRCCAWLIFREEHIVLFTPKRSCFRFAALTLRVTSHRNVPLGHSGVAHGLFSFRTITPNGAPVFRSAYSASRNARASAAFAASIEAHCAVCRETLMLQVRCARPAPSHRNDPLGRSGVTVGLFSAKSTQYSLLQNARPPGSLRSPYG